MHKYSTTKVGKFYDLVAPVYSVVDMFLKYQKKQLIQTINTYPVGRILEIGVGTGSHLELYQRHSVVGIDLSDRMLQKAERQRSSANVSLQKMNGEHLEYSNNKFDYVVIMHVLAVTPSPEKLMKEAIRVLKPSGFLFILNHDSPDTWVGLIDKVFDGLCRFVGFSSAFVVPELGSLNELTLVEGDKPSSRRYIKCFIYQND